MTDHLAARCHQAYLRSRPHDGTPLPHVHVITTLGPTNEQAILLPAIIGWRALASAYA